MSIKKNEEKTATNNSKHSRTETKFQKLWAKFVLFKLQLCLERNCEVRNT